MSVYGTPAVKIILNTTDPSGSFILNQYAGPQTGNFWVTGKGRVDTRLGIGGLDPAYALHVATVDPISASFSGRVIGADAVNPNEFITKAQMETAIAVGASLTATQVGYGSPTNTLTGSSNMTFTAGTGKLTLNTATGRLIQLGSTAPVAGPNPVQIHMGGSYSDTAGVNLKFVIYDNNIGGISGFGMSSSGLDHVSGGGSHKFFIGATQVFGMSATQISVLNSLQIVWEDLLVPKLSYYGGPGGGPATFHTGVATATLYTNVPTGAKHSLRINAVEAFNISGAGAAITTVSQDDTKTSILTWDSTDKLVRWRSASSIIPVPDTHALLSTIHTDTVPGAPVLGAMIIGNATSAWDRLLGHTVAAKRFLTQTGTGINSAIPIWGSITAGDLPDLTGTYVPVTRTLTINGNSQTLAADRTWTITTTGTINRITVTGGAGVTPTIDIAATYVGQASITTVGTITTGVWNGTTIATGFGGTGLTSYVLGDILYASAANVLAALPGNITTTRRFLVQTGTGVISAAPQWVLIAAADLPDLSLTYVPTARTLTINGSAQDLSANRVWTITTTGTVNRITVTGGAGLTPTIDIAATYAGQASIVTVGTITTGTWNGSPIGPTYGGTGITSYTLGDTLYASATNVLSKLPGNITTGKLFLSQTGTGVVSAAPVWSAMAGTDITGAALTKTDDTNVTLTLGGSPATALLRATSITVGWTGTLPVTRGGTGLATVVQGDILYASAADTLARLAKSAGTNMFLKNSGTSNNPAWSAITAADIGVGAALTKVDDTNVTLTLTGTPSAALLAASGITVGWAGSLAPGRGGTGITTYVLGDTLYASAANVLSKLSGNITAVKQFLSQTGTGAVSAAPVWATIVPANLSMATARILGRLTAGTGSVEELTGTQVTTMLDLFSTTATTKGLVPGSNGAATTNFLRADGVWAVPPAGGGGGYTTLSQFVDETAWRMYYSNAAGDITPFALGTANQVLQSTGVSAAPTWVTIGSGTIGGSLAATQVAYGSAANTITGSSNFIFTNGTGTLTLGTASGKLIQLGDTTAVAIANPVAINMGASHSSVAGSNLKLLLFDNAVGVTAGFGISNAQMDYVAGTGILHHFYQAGVHIVSMNTTQIGIYGSGQIGWENNVGQKMNFYGGPSGGAGGYNMGVASGTLYWNAPTAAKHSFQVNGVEWHSVGSAGTTIMTTIQAISNIGHLINMIPGQTANNIEVRYSGYPAFQVDNTGSVIASSAGTSQVRVGVDKSSNQYGGIWIGDNAPSATTANFTLLRGGDYTTLNATGTLGRIIFARGNDISNMMVFTEERKLGIGYTYNVPTATLNRRLNVWDGDGFTTAPFALAKFSRYVYPGTASTGASGVIEFGLTTQINAGNEEIGSTIGTVLVSGVAGAETFDFVISNMTAGAYPTEKFRSLSTGEIAVQTLTQNDALTKVAVWDDTSKLIKWRLASTIGGGGGITSLGPIGVASNAAGATITGSVLNLESASIAFGGVINTTAQEFTGLKTFRGGLTSHNGDTQNLRVGHNAMPGLTTGTYNTGIGHLAGSNVGTQSENTYVGSYSGYQNTGSSNTALGLASLQTGTGNNNVALGSRALGALGGSASSNIAIGSNAMFNASGAGATQNIAIGEYAGQGIQTGYNVLIGFGTASQVIAGGGGANVLIGFEAGRIGPNLTSTTFIGYQAGYQATSDYSVFLGYKAGYLEVTNYRLVIETTSATPLIEGSFTATRYVRINNAFLSVPGAGGYSERFGWNATAGDNAVAVGYNANSGGYSVVIGTNASGGGVVVGYQAFNTRGTIAIGNSSQAVEYYSLAIGQTAIATGYGSVIIGHESQGQGISIGYQTYSGGGQFVAGNLQFPTSQVYFGSGVTHTAPVAYTIFGSGASGTDIAGGNIGMASGKGTGAATPSLIRFYTPEATTSGTTVQSLVNRLTVAQYGIQPYMANWSVAPAGSAGYMQYNQFNNAMCYHDSTTWRYFLSSGNGAAGLQTGLRVSNGLKWYYDGSYNFRWEVLLGDAYSWTGEPNLGSSALGAPRYIPLNGHTFSFVKGMTEDPSYATFVNHGMTIGHSVYIPDVPILRVGAFAGVTKSGWWNPVGATGPGILAHFYSPPITYTNPAFSVYSVVTIENDAGPDYVGSNLSNGHAHTALTVLLRMNTVDGAQTSQEWIALRVASDNVVGNGVGGLLGSRMYSIKATKGRIYSQDGFHFGSKIADDSELALAGYMTFRSDTGKFRAFDGAAWRNIAYEGALSTPWRVFYSDGAGVMTELAIGAAGLVLTSNGAAAAPSWIAPPGGGGGGTPGLPDTSVQYNGAGSFAGSADMTFASGTLSLNKTSGKNLQLGTAAPVSSANPVSINMGASSSSSAGVNLKLLLYDDGSIKAGFGISPNGTDYVAYIHTFYTLDAVQRVHINDTQIGILGAMQIGWDNSYSQKINFYGFPSGGASGHNMGVDAASLWWNVPTAAVHAFRVQGVNAFTIGAAGATITTVTQDDALTSVMVWDSATKAVKWRASSTLGGGSPTRFGKAGEDTTAAEDRDFFLGNHHYRIQDAASSSLLDFWLAKASNGYSEMYFQAGSNGDFNGLAFISLAMESTLTPNITTRIGVINTGGTQDVLWTFTKGEALLGLGSASVLKIEGLDEAVGTKTLRYDPTTGLVTYHDIPSGGGAGGVASFSFTNANGFTGVVTTATTTPNLTISTNLTLGSVPFIGASGGLLQDNALFFWDNTNKRLGVGTNAPGYRFHVNGSAYVNNSFAHNVQGGWGAFLNNTSQVPAGSTFTAGYTWAGGASSNTMQYAGSMTINQGAIIAGHTVSNRTEFTAAGATITLTQAAGIRALAGLQILSQIVGTIGGTVTHGASLMIQGVYPTSTGVVQFNNYYGILINPLDEWLIVTFTNRWAIYQQGPNDPSYFASRIQIGSVTNQSTTNLLEVTGGFYVNATTATMRFVGLTTDNAATQVLAKNTAGDNVWRDVSSISGGGGTIGGSIAPGQVAYGSGTANSIVGSADITFALGTLRLTKLTGVDLQLGDLTSAASATPVQINLGGSFSSTVNTSPKLAIYDNGAGAVYGIGIAASTMFYTVPAAVAHRFYVGTVSALMLGVGGGIGNYIQSPTLTDVSLHIFVDPSNSANAFEIKTGIVIVHSVSNAGNGYYAGNLTIANAKSFSGRLAPRVATVTTIATSSIDSDAVDMYTVTALAGTMVMANPGGTPVNGQKLTIRIKDNGTTKTLTWSGSQWRSGEFLLPVSTIPNRTMYLGFIWNSTDSRWDFIAYSDNYA